MKKIVALLVLFAAMPALAQDKLHLYNWNNYIAPETVKRFEQECKCQVVQTYYSDNDELLAKLAAGARGYDVLVPTSNAVQALIRGNQLRPLDKSKLPNLRYLDPWVMQSVAADDPGIRYGVPYLWGTTGFAYNERMVRERMPDAPVTSGDMVFKPEVVKRFADCGVTFLDEPTDVIPMAMLYLGHDPNSVDPDDLADVERLLKAVRPYIRYFSSAKMLIDLPNEEVCIAMSWSGDYAQAMMRAQQVGKPVPLAYTTQKEGTLAWFDLWFIPADAPHPELAHAFLDFTLEAEIAAEICRTMKYSSPNRAALALLPREIRENPAIFPPPEVAQRLEWLRDISEAVPVYERLWTEVKTSR